MELTDNEKIQVERIKSKIGAVRATDPDFKHFGSISHKYTWNHPATDKEIIEFESNLNIELPRELRIFLKYVANGGAAFAYTCYTI